MRSVLFAALLLLHIFSAKAQVNTQRRLEVGDTLPEITLDVLERGKHAILNSRSLQGKLVIFDFWNVHCSSCIAEFPKLDSLQHIFDRKLQIILVTKDTDKDIDKLFSRIKIPRPSLPMVNADSLLHSMFRIALFPGQIWIGPNGLVTEMPISANANKITLDAYLSGSKPKMLQRGKIDFYINQPLLPQLSRDSSITIKYSSVLVQGMEERGARSISMSVDPNNSKVYTVKAINQPLYVLYRMAFERELMGENYNSFSQFNNTRVILNVPAEGFKEPPKELSERDHWRRSSCYTYELNMPIERSKYILDQMKADLKNNFGYNARLEKRMVKCAVLINSGYKKTSPLNSDEKIKSSFGYDQEGFTLVNSSIKNLISQVLILIYARRKTDPMPVIDETGINGGVNLRISGDYSDIGNLKKQLNKYGLDIIVAERNIDMLVISEPDKDIPRK